MKYIFCSFMFDDVEENVRNSKSPNSVSGHKFQINMLNGLAENGCDISVVNIPRVRRYPDYKRILFRRGRFRTECVKDSVSIGYINLWGLNYFTQIHNVYKELKKKIWQYQNEKIVLLVFNTYPAPTIAMRKIKKLYPNVIICNVIGDIYGRFGLNLERSLHGKIIGMIHKMMDKFASECDAFALATENMAKALNISEKPYIVIEGMYDVTEKAENVEIGNSGKKIVFYAGALLEEYGIGHMLRAFSLIEDSSYQFFIAGGGDAVEEIKACAEGDPRIQYLGFITPKEVEQYQAMATVLVNPRTSEHEYVKYSFASKNLECLASGVPYIAHRLPCNPAEYASCIIYPDNESDEALANKIQEICNMGREQRIRIGRFNREFIKNNKNPKVQMKCLDTLLRSM